MTTIEIVEKWDQQLQLANRNLISREKVSLIERLTDIALIRQEMTYHAALAFYTGKSREELRAIMRTVKGICRLSFMPLTQGNIDIWSNWIRYADKTDNNILAIDAMQLL